MNIFARIRGFSFLHSQFSIFHYPMPTNLHALIRYRTIDESLHRPQKRWDWKNLAQACGDALRYYIDSEMPNPSRRTVMYDIDTMKHGKLGYEAPIEWDRERKSYYYTDLEFSLSNTPLNQDDLSELNHALVILKQFSGFRHMEGIENIITKLDYTLSLRAGRAKEAIHFDHQINAPGQRWLDRLYRSIQNEIVLELDYQPFYYDMPFTTWVSPYLLKEYNKRWFLICWDFNMSAIRNYALDRIQRIEATTKTFHHDPNFDPARYFEDIIGVTLLEGEAVQEILLRFTNRQAKYIKTKPLHPSQTLVEETEAHTTFSFRLMVNYELESLILSFGEKVEVLQPALLKEKIEERIQQMIENYGSVQ